MLEHVSGLSLLYRMYNQLSARLLHRALCPFLLATLEHVSGLSILAWMYNRLSARLLLGAL